MVLESGYRVFLAAKVDVNESKVSEGLQLRQSGHVAEFPNTETQK